MQTRLHPRSSLRGLGALLKQLKKHLGGLGGEPGDTEGVRLRYSDVGMGRDCVHSLSRGLAMLPSLPTSAQEEGRPGWAISVPWTLRAAWHQPCIPRQAWEPDAALRWYLLLRPAKSRTWLLQCVPRRFPSYPAMVVGQAFMIALLLQDACAS